MLETKFVQIIVHDISISYCYDWYALFYAGQNG